MSRPSLPACASHAHQSRDRQTRAVEAHADQRRKKIDDTYQLLKSFVAIKPYPTMDGFKTIFDDLAKRVPAAKNANPKEFVDTRFIEELDKAGYIDGLYR
jgi:hypothetical protein